ncbi:MAG TPA: type I DNA topoisomerase [Anaerolineae bacterium]|nr:type I DNA topoisomerase [Anaerolineae bacterium]
MLNPTPTFTANGVPATKGTCPVCSTGLFRMGRTEAHEGLEPTSVVKKPKQRKGTSGKRRSKLVIVESPAKARTVGRFLGKDYKVAASVGHVRDLLRSQLSVDVENDFKPKYRVPNEKRKAVKELIAAAAKSREVYLATDPDREGEAIAWHLLEAAKIDPEIAHRVIFHEITKSAIERAFENPREISMDLVNAQQASRILDRLVGYNLSPLLWAKVRGRLSAGRVQSVALRLIVEREREIQAFVPKEYWSIDAELLHPEKPPAFLARLVQIDGANPELNSETEVQPVLQEMREAKYQVSQVRRGSRIRRASPPYTTSTLQQSASRRLGYTARRTMVIAQQLYEGIDLGQTERVGLITYMRTDSVNVAESAIHEAREWIRRKFGEAYLPEKPPTYRTRSHRAQEAHEAIRPTSVEREPEKIKPFLSEEQFRLYSLIWSRFIASQMKPAEYDTLSIEVEGRTIERIFLLRVTASSLRFPGFLEFYGDKESINGAKGNGEGLKVQLAQLPALVEGEALILQELLPEQHFTQPPRRYSDASLVRALEDNGIGRPSTYAPIISTLRQRGYMQRQNRSLVPTEIGEIVHDLIFEFFPNIVDLGFTAQMEEKLDEIAAGEREWVEVVRDFYQPFEEQVRHAEEVMPEVKAEPEKIDRTCPECGHPLIIRHGRFGKFIGCSNFPTCRYTEPWLEKIGVKCPKDGGELVQRQTRRGRVFYGCVNYPDCDFTSWKRPLPYSCPDCNNMMVASNQEHAQCLNCGKKMKQKELSEL